jgi:hypothetical protein
MAHYDADGAGTIHPIHPIRTADLRHFLLDSNFKQTKSDKA